MSPPQNEEQTMSAFVVSADTMNKVVRTICAKGRYGQRIRTFAGIATDAPNAKTEIGRRLLTMNVEAVNQRYPGDETSPYGTDYAFRGSNIPPARKELIAGFKAMQCLEYQCSEGDVDQSALYAELTAAIGKIAEAIVTEMEEYQAAAWG
jgi:hypothetical protein